MQKTEKYKDEKGLVVIRTDNGPQFVNYKFKEYYRELKLHHERIPVKIPNKNAHVESFHRILKDECFKSNEFPVPYKLYNSKFHYCL